MTFGLERKRLNMRVAFHPCTSAYLRGFRYGTVGGWRGDNVTVRPDRSTRSIQVPADLLAEVVR